MWRGFVVGAAAIAAASAIMVYIQAWLAEQPSGSDRVRSSHGVRLLAAGTLDARSYRPDWSIAYFDVYCGSNGFAAGIAGRTAFALNGTTATLAQQGVTLIKDGETILMVIPEQPYLAQAGLTSATGDPLRYNRAIAEARSMARARCGW